jgi:hypothetical protein
MMESRVIARSEFASAFEVIWVSYGNSRLYFDIIAANGQKERGRQK